jgi:hypothetical protein
MSPKVDDLQSMFLSVQNVIRSQQFTINVPQRLKCHQKSVIYNRCPSEFKMSPKVGNSQLMSLSVQNVTKSR